MLLLLLGASCPLALHPSGLAASPRPMRAQRSGRERLAMVESLPEANSGGVNSFLRDVDSLWGKVVGAEPKSGGLLDLPMTSSATDDLEFVPLVLVVGATGRTGRIITRKLVLQGFRVAVLVRSLSSETLNLLGSGVSYSYGDMLDYRTLLDAMEDVDKVIFAADTQKTSAEDELTGLSNVIRSFQDTRTFMYGDAEATKLSLFKFRKETDFGRWSIESKDDSLAERLAVSGLGIGSKPVVAYWKRSDTKAHNNGVFVGKVFDVYLGSAVVSCRLVAPAAVEAGGGDEATASGTAAGGDGINLREYSGLVVKAIGDGKKYTAVVRTSLYESKGIEYHATFETKKSRFVNARLPFASFEPMKDGRAITQDADGTIPELDRRDVTGLAFAFLPQLNNPSTCDGEFYLSVGHIKTYRTRDEPEFVYLSEAGVMGGVTAPTAAGPLTAAAATAENSAAVEGGTVEGEAEGEGHKAKPLRRTEAKARGEELLLSSGLTYFIMRPSDLSDTPGGRRQIAFSQEPIPSSTGALSRADVAEVAVRSLLDPRACNVACALYESQYVEKVEKGKQDISKALEVLEPNRS